MLANDRKKAFIYDPKYRNGEPAKITGFGFHIFRGINQECFETRFKDKEERLVPLRWLIDLTLEQEDLLSVYITDNDSPSIPYREARRELNV